MLVRCHRSDRSNADHDPGSRPPDDPIRRHHRATTVKCELCTQDDWCDVRKQRLGPDSRTPAAAEDHCTPKTACRRGGALALAPEDLDPEQCLIRLHEKGGTVRWQPVSPTLMTHLLAHAESRGGLESRERVLRYATGKPINSRRYDYLWGRLGEDLPWVKTQQVSTHWIRHTILTWVERRFGFAVAQAYAGHQDDSRGARAMSSTGTYVRAGLPEIATALSVLTGEPHPLAPEGPSADARNFSDQ